MKRLLLRGIVIGMLYATLTVAVIYFIETPRRVSKMEPATGEDTAPMSKNSVSRTTILKRSTRY
jgi:hypothetical protein